MSTRRSPKSCENGDRASMSKNRNQIFNDTDIGVLLIMALVIAPAIAGAAIIASIAR